MTHPAIPALLLLALAPAAAPGDAVPDRFALAQLTIHQRIVIRIPRVLHREPRSEPKPLRLVEKKGPKCLPTGTLVGAIVEESDSVDLLMIDGSRMRARLEDHCPALDFYSGLYMKQSDDGLVCAKRDSIRSRSGSLCRIDGFRRLELKR